VSTPEIIFLYSEAFATYPHFNIARLYIRFMVGICCKWSQHVVS